MWLLFFELLSALEQADVDILGTHVPVRVLDNLGIGLVPGRQELGIALELHTVVVVVVRWAAHNTEVSFGCITNHIATNFLKM